MALDFTLVVPTYDRSNELYRLLSYLAREKAQFPVLILDSSHESHRLANQENIKSLNLNVVYCEYDPTILPFDKFYDGVAQVKTQFCQLCADDDFIMVPEAKKCIDALLGSPDASIAHGYYFAFFEGDKQQSFELTQILYFTPSNDENEPLLRLRNLFRQYQALTYGMYRTPVLQEILLAVKNVDRILSRELLASALAVVKGKVIRLPFFTHGRSMGASQSYQFWHPLEWLAKTPAGLFQEYNAYKKILIKAIMHSPENQDEEKEVERRVDLIHMDYLLRHAPLKAYEYLLDNVLRDKKVDEVWPALEIQIPLIEAAGAQNVHPTLTWQERVINKLIKSFRLKKQENTQVGWEDFDSPVRSYRLHANFLRPAFAKGTFIGKQEINRLTIALDNY